MTLLEMVRRYQELLTIKEELAGKTKLNNAAIEEAKQEIAQQMVDDDCPSISTGGYKFSLQEKTVYSKRSEVELAKAGASFFGALRDEGLGDIIVERVDPRTLQSTMKNYVEENGGLSEGLQQVITVYDTFDINRRKETNRATKGAKK